MKKKANMFMPYSKKEIGRMYIMSRLSPILPINQKDAIAVTPYARFSFTNISSASA